MLSDTSALEEFNQSEAHKLFALCAAGVVTGTADKNSSRYRYSGNRRTRRVRLHVGGGGGEWQ